jgi:hypothetical protein
MWCTGCCGGGQNQRQEPGIVLLNQRLLSAAGASKAAAQQPSACKALLGTQTAHTCSACSTPSTHVEQCGLAPVGQGCLVIGVCRLHLSAIPSQVHLAPTLARLAMGPCITAAGPAGLAVPQVGLPLAAVAVPAWARMYTPPEVCLQLRATSDSSYGDCGHGGRACKHTADVIPGCLHPYKQ